MPFDVLVSKKEALHNIRVVVAHDIWKGPGNVRAIAKVLVKAEIRAVAITTAWQYH
jgi:hypothetical protein